MAGRRDFVLHSAGKNLQETKLADRAPALMPDMIHLMRSLINTH